MTNATQNTDMAIEAGAHRRAVLKQPWMVAPAETTSRNLDKIVKHKSESDESKQSDSPSSPLVADSDLVENIHQAVLDYYQGLVNEMLQTSDFKFLTSYVVSSDSSTPTLDYHSSDVEAQSVKNEVERLFSLATFIDLEPGMANEFSDGLEQVVERHGTKALDAIKRMILDEETASSIAMEALKYIGNADSVSWHDERRLMLEDCLRRSHSAWVRDGAGLGLSSLDNPRSIPAIERAVTNESSKALKEDLELVLKQLKRTIGA
ncbi:MAG: hypothetical protein OXI34_05200 [Chloroflexota bacterium]|nr:hypothetical protein [Chloroflexota bacterium]MDE2947388.1 hypothetical protein [Chloroflexota bacterium]